MAILIGDNEVAQLCADLALAKTAARAFLSGEMDCSPHTPNDFGTPGYIYFSAQCIQCKQRSLMAVERPLPDEEVRYFLERASHRLDCPVGAAAETYLSAQMWINHLSGLESYVPAQIVIETMSESDEWRGLINDEV